MASIRELILSNIHARLAQSTLFTAHRSRRAAFALTESPAVVVEPILESIAPVVLDYVDRSMLISLTTIARGSIPDSVAADAVAEAHRILLLDPTHGGKAIDTKEDGRTWQIESADNDAAVVESRYSILYRTRRENESLGYP